MRWIVKCTQTWSLCQPLFFFSSRRRHTRCGRDWSSDVCSSDLEQFVQCFADVSGRDMRQFMRWYSQAGTPEIKVESQYDPAARSLRLEITQSVPPTPGQPTKQPMLIPLAFGLVG